jgi:beta-galactosidase
MSPLSLNRRDFVLSAGSTSVALIGLADLRAEAGQSPNSDMFSIPDVGWRLWLDEAAAWQDDAIYLPDDVDLKAMSVNSPTGGWDCLDDSGGLAVALPATVEQFYWGKQGLRPYAPEEYSYAGRDLVPQNGAYRGVSWWWRSIDIPKSFRGKRILLHVRGARMRAEVFLNRRLVGYSIMEELPFVCDLTEAARAGEKNFLAIRITNPGGRFDWVDGEVIHWGKVDLYRSHGFGGVDRGMSLSAHPLDGHIEDVWVLNRPQPRTIHAFVKVSGGTAIESPSLEIRGAASGRPLQMRIRFVGQGADGTCEYEVTAKTAELWSLDKPTLYRLTARWQSPQGGISLKSVVFGFRWFAPDGLGSDAVFRLNGRRIKIYTAISWGYWGMNGLWPTPDLADKEVLQAKALGLNCLNFHRNVGKPDVLDAHDRYGLLRVMEPGGGKLAMGRWPAGLRSDANSVVMQPPKSEADRFSQAFMRAKCAAMVRAFRSHPSLVQYTLQNEAGADLTDPATFAALEVMRAEDKSRTIVLNDGMTAPPTSAAQLWYAPYDPRPYRSDTEPFGGWWNDHQGAADQWYDEFYLDPNRFNYNQPQRRALVQFGEMEGCAVPDDHQKTVTEILRRGGTSYDLADHRAILSAYEAFLDRWGFRAAFPTASALFAALGRKSYESWQQYLENVRINDSADFVAISGWESTAIENHSGIVDNFRNCKGDPALIRSSLMPVRPLAKQRHRCIARADAAVFDLYLLNDTGIRPRGELIFTMADPRGRETRLGVFAIPQMRPDQFNMHIETGFVTPPLTEEGAYRFTFALSSLPQTAQVREIWVADAVLPPLLDRTLRVAVYGVRDDTRAQLQALPSVTVSEFSSAAACDVIVAGGLTAQSTPAQRLGGEAGIQLQRQSNLPSVPGRLPQEAIAAVKSGMPLFAIAQEDSLADGIALQLSAAGAFRYEGQVGKLRAPWMGNWYFLRAHPVFDAMPVDCAMGGFYQAHGRAGNGLIVDGAGVDVFVGYGRDHDRRVGAGTFSARLGEGRILFHRVPDFTGPLQQRFLRNALAWLYRQTLAHLGS